MEPHSTASHMVTMAACTTTVLTDTPCLFTFLNDGGRMPSCAVSRSARDGPTIHADISASTPSAKSRATANTIQLNAGPICSTYMARNASITPNDRLPSSTLAGSVVATAKPPSASSAMVSTAKMIMASG